MKKLPVKGAKYLLSLVGACLLLWIIRKAGWGKIVEILSSMSPLFLFLAILVWMLNLAFGTLRFKRFLATDLSFFLLLELYLLGSLLNYAGGIQGFGVGARIGLLKMKKVSISRSTASIGSEIAYDIILASIVSVAGICVYGKLIFEELFSRLMPKFLILPAVMILLFLSAMFLLRKNEFLGHFMRNFLRAFSSRNVVGNILNTLGLYGSVIVMFFLLYKAAGIWINPLILMFAVSISYIIGLMSLIPGGLGVRDAVTGYVCSLAGIDINTALSIAIITRFICLSFNSIVLLIFVISRRMHDKTSSHAES